MFEKPFDHFSKPEYRQAETSALSFSRITTPVYMSHLTKTAIFKINELSSKNFVLSTTTKKYYNSEILIFHILKKNFFKHLHFCCVSHRVGIYGYS